MAKKVSIFVAIPRWPAIKLMIFMKMRAAFLAKSSCLASREMAATTSQFDRILQYKDMAIVPGGSNFVDFLRNNVN